MGNCLKSSGGAQNDNATLLNNSPDPAMSGSLSQDQLNSQAMPYNELVDSRYPVVSTRERHVRSTESSIGGLGQGIGMTTGNIRGTGLMNSATINEEEHQVRIAKRIGLIQHLPSREYDGAKKGECVICMMELTIGEAVRYLPCMHTYHAMCIDDWLLRSLTCPSCMEPVDAALINSYHPTT
ncbi:GSCOCG00005173001-RA-CDS [Cotesia congregata]|uniref:Similar to RNF11: RING finger protein 11 (Homo sapiens) n=1 Tax=Cotesia congregata TaxID=51543 RepID=A0A8J2HKV5_COTCN|nr:GSCOCG00005173001-RA-CDS [Cotesia congregata]CAG5101328.1 Similar to RNF11: RING finger protein 11 (Homo sapiens) [Cotesia congregata]